MLTVVFPRRVAHYAGIFVFWKVAVCCEVSLLIYFCVTCVGIGGLAMLLQGIFSCESFIAKGAAEGGLVRVQSTASDVHAVL